MVYLIGVFRTICLIQSIFKNRSIWNNISKHFHTDIIIIIDTFVYFILHFKSQTIHHPIVQVENDFASLDLFLIIFRYLKTKKIISWW